jgi:hypothetical protein
MYFETYEIEKFFHCLFKSNFWYLIKLTNDFNLNNSQNED